MISIKLSPRDIEIDELIISTLLLDQFDLCVESISLFGHGLSNIIYLINGKWAFRFPMRSKAAALVAKEMRVLPRLRNRLPLAIPEPIFFGQPSQIFKRPFYGYELVKGKPASEIRLSDGEYDQAAYRLGSFLKGLHEIDITELRISEEDVF